MSTADTLAARKRHLYDQLDVLMRELRDRSRPILDELILIEKLSVPAPVTIDPPILEQIRAAD